MNKDKAVAKKYKVAARTLDKAKDRIINAYISDAQRLTEGVGMSLEFLRALTKAMGYKAVASKNDEYFYVR